MKKLISLSIVFVLLLGGFLANSAIAGGKYTLWGKQIAGSGHAKNARNEGNKLVLTKPAKIIKVEGTAKRYAIWSKGRAFLSGGTKKSIVDQVLPAGSYSVMAGLDQRQRSAKVTITLTDN